MDFKNHKLITQPKDIGDLDYNSLPGLTAPFEPLIYECPHHASIHEILIEWIDSTTEVTVNGGARRTRFYTGSDRPLRAHDVLFDWIESLLYDAVRRLAMYTNSAYNESPDETRIFKIADYWGMMYDEGGGAVLHNHFPYSLSFGYYLRVPEGSSPLIVEEYKIPVEEGRLVLWAAHQPHEVPDCEVGGRCMIAGNVSYAGVDR